MQELAHPLTQFKTVTIEQILEHLENKYPAEPEEVALQEALLREGWDANNHIENLFQTVRLGCETLHDMKAIEGNDLNKTFVKHVYLAIRESGQFESACIKWKALPPTERETVAQIRTFFSRKYDVFDAQQNSLHHSGIANSVQLQEILQATSDGLSHVRDRQQEQDTRQRLQEARQEKQDAFNTTLMQLAKSKPTDIDDTVTTFSAMTAHLAVQEQRIAELESII